MLDKTKRYREVGYNAYGIKYAQEGKLFKLDGSEVDSLGRKLQKPYPAWAAPELFEEYEPEFPAVNELDNVRAGLDKLGISWHPNAKLETLRKRLEDAR